MQTPRGGYTFYEEPVSKEAYRAALYLMYADYLKSFKNFEQIRASCGEADSYISTLDEIEVMLGHYKEEIFFELERSEVFEGRRMYQIPQSLLEHPVHEERAFCRLAKEMSHLWKKLQSARKPAEAVSGAAFDPSGSLPPKPPKSTRPEKSLSYKANAESFGTDLQIHAATQQSPGSEGFCYGHESGEHGSLRYDPDVRVCLLTGRRLIKVSSIKCKLSEG